MRAKSLKFMLLLALLAGLIAPSWRGAMGAALAEAGEATLEIWPQTTVVTVGQEFVVQVMILAGDQEVQGAQIFLDFDPALLEALEVIPSPDLPQDLPMTIPRIDNEAGQINYAAGKLMGQLPSGTFTALSVRFRARQLTVGTPILFAKRRHVPPTGFWDTVVTYGVAEHMALTFHNGRVIVAMPTATPSPEPTSTPSGYRLRLPLILRAFAV